MNIVSYRFSDGVDRAVSRLTATIIERLEEQYRGREIAAIRKHLAPEAQGERLVLAETRTIPFPEVMDWIKTPSGIRAALIECILAGTPTLSSDQAAALCDIHAMKDLVGIINPTPSPSADPTPASAPATGTMEATAAATGSHASASEGS